MPTSQSNISFRVMALIYRGRRNLLYSLYTIFTLHTKLRNYNAQHYRFRTPAQ